MKQTITILGSTGSIGLSALQILDKEKKNYKFNTLSANKNFNLICKQINKYKPIFFVVKDQRVFKKVEQKFKKKKNYNFK